jgi:UDP-N-acetylmuramate--L-alanine ligase
MKLAHGAHIHILGIAGHAMRGVALAAVDLGYVVTGTDETAYSPGSDWLDEQGITWYRQADVAHITGVDLLVLGGGVAVDHPELLAAQDQGIAIQSYPEFVSTLIPTANRIVVTGTHGKTTTTSFIAWLLESAGRKPDFLVGIQPKNFESSVRLGGGEVAVLEGDEYRSSRLDTSSKFSHYQAKTAIITSIEMDHPDLFADLAAVRERFDGLVENLPEDGLLVYCNDSQIIAEVASKSKAEAVSYGDEDAHWQAVNTEFNKDGISFDLQHDSELVGSVSAPLYGAHNVANATAALAVCLSQGISIEDLQAGATSFLGASRRFERVSAPDDDVTVIDDYAHHPTEVAATLAAAKQHFAGKIFAVFQPHTYSRTQSLLKEYQACFNDADTAYVVDIEGAREAGVSADITSAALATEPNVHYAADRAQLITDLKESMQPGDVLISMSVNGYQSFAAEIHTVLNS